MGYITMALADLRPTMKSQKSNVRLLDRHKLIQTGMKITSALTIAFAGLHGTAHADENASIRSLHCSLSNNNIAKIEVYTCNLNPNSTYLKSSLGMGKSEIFKNICIEVPTSMYFLGAGKPLSYTSSKMGFSCRDWPAFSRADYWAFRSPPAKPCVGLRYLTLQFRQDRLVYMLVACTKW